ncbi:MAG: hypothetical protein HY017_27380 [Betaproteobacteria bacterium]|nr:hypothetical protein [Betaproteobacteria bacterium]
MVTVALAAGLAILNLVARPVFVEHLEQTTRTLIKGLAAGAQRAGVAFSAPSVCSMFGI